MRISNIFSFKYVKLTPLLLMPWFYKNKYQKPIKCHLEEDDENTMKNTNNNYNTEDEYDDDVKQMNAGSNDD